MKNKNKIKNLKKTSQLKLVKYFTFLPYIALVWMLIYIFFRSNFSLEALLESNIQN